MTDPPRIRLARLPTPFERLSNLEVTGNGPRIWVKRDDLTEGPAGGNKLRKLEFSIGQAMADGADVLITAGATQSNHCRQTAFAAAKLGLGCHLVLRADRQPSSLDGNLLLDDILGADITYVTTDEFDELPAVFDRLADDHRARGETPFCIPVGASDEIGLWGYIEAGRELAADFAAKDIEPTHIVAAVGSGGTHAGLMLGTGLAGLDTEVLGVSVARSVGYLEDRIDELVERWAARYRATGPRPGRRPSLLGGYIGPGYGQADPAVYRTIKDLAGTEGLILDPVYTGKAFDAMIKELTAGRFDGSDDVVFLHTGGIYGLFPHRDNFVSV